MKRLGQMFEKPGLLLKVDVDAAIESGCANAFVVLIKSDGKIERDHEDRMASAPQGVDKGVVAEAISAVHGSGTRSYLDDIQASFLRLRDDGE